MGIAHSPGSVRTIHGGIVRMVHVSGVPGVAHRRRPSRRSTVRSAAHRRRIGPASRTGVGPGVRSWRMSRWSVMASRSMLRRTHVRCGGGSWWGRRTALLVVLSGGKNSQADERDKNEPTPKRLTVISEWIHRQAPD